MQFSKALLLFPLLLAATIIASQNKSVRNVTRATDTSALWRIVEEMNRKQIETFNNGDLLGVARIYADDATIYFPHYQSKQGQKIHGRGD